MLVSKNSQLVCTLLAGFVATELTKDIWEGDAPLSVVKTKTIHTRLSWLLQNRIKLTRRVDSFSSAPYHRLCNWCLRGTRDVLAPPMRRFAHSIKSWPFCCLQTDDDDVISIYSDSKLKVRRTSQHAQLRTRRSVSWRKKFTDNYLVRISHQILLYVNIVAILLVGYREELATLDATVVERVVIVVPISIPIRLSRSVDIVHPHCRFALLLLEGCWRLA